MNKRIFKSSQPGRPKGHKTHDPQTAKIFGSVVRDLRIERGISQESLANIASIERAHMGRIERGEHTLMLPQILKIARALDVRSGVLLDKTEEKIVVDKRQHVLD